MTKQVFLNELATRLKGLPQADIDDRLNFYSEMIDDRMEDGLSEEEAVAGIGPVSSVASQIIQDTPLQRIVIEKVTPKRDLKWWEITLIIVGFPVWFPLLISFFAIVLSVYVVIWSVIISLWAVDLSFAAGAIGGIILGIISIAQGKFPAGILIICASLVCAGLAILMFYVCLAASKGAIKLAKKFALFVKKIFLGKDK